MFGQPSEDGAFPEESTHAPGEMSKIRDEKVQLISETQEGFHPGRIFRGGEFSDGFDPFGVWCDPCVGNNVTSKGQAGADAEFLTGCLLYTSPSPRDS